MPRKSTFNLEGEFENVDEYEEWERKQKSLTLGLLQNHKQSIVEYAIRDSTKCRKSFPKISIV